MGKLQQINKELSSYLTVDKICELYPDFTKWSIEYHIRNRDRNGLDQYIVKIGGQFYIDKVDFDEWIKTYFEEC
jgi:hypothetical protein